MFSRVSVGGQEAVQVVPLSGLCPGSAVHSCHPTIRPEDRLHGPMFCLSNKGILFGNHTDLDDILGFPGLSLYFRLPTTLRLVSVIA